MKIGSTASWLVCAALAACGGGDSAATAGPDTAERAAAATSTAQSGANVCASVAPFYWEIGDRSARLAAGSVTLAGSSTSYQATTSMNIASASKWLYGAYVAQKRNGVLTASDIEFLTFRSGYTNFSTCLPGETVDGCLSRLDNGVQTPATQGLYFYNGGHMQKHASLEGLGSLDNAGLAAAVQAQIGSDIALGYSQPQPAGGAVSTADDYARFLRKLLAGQLRLGAALGSNAACTNPATCAQAVSTPVPRSISWHYSIGHWVEDDPVTGDGAFSSPGAFGFYPWIDASRSYYGVVARLVNAGWYESAQCGALIRKAWLSGKAQ